MSEIIIKKKGFFFSEASRVSFGLVSLKKKKKKVVSDVRGVSVRFALSLNLLLSLPMDYYNQKKITFLDLKIAFFLLSVFVYPARIPISRNDLSFHFAFFSSALFCFFNSNFFFFFFNRIQRTHSVLKSLCLKTRVSHFY